MRLFLFKGVVPPHLGVRLPPKVCNHTFGLPWGGKSPPLIIRVKDLHPWSPRTQKEPVYIRFYFPSPLSFLLSLSIRLLERSGEKVEAQGEHFLMINVVLENKSS